MITWDKKKMVMLHRMKDVIHCSGTEAQTEFAI